MIPYAIERRPDTGVNNVTLGIWLFLASEVMLFGALFSAYALIRSAAAVWPAGRTVLSLRIATANTAILAVATAAVWRAHADGRRARAWIVAASGLAAAFLALKTVEYTGEWSRGLRPSTSTFFATYFTLTGLHALHVVAGIAANTWAAAGAAWTDGRGAGRRHALALYWTFVDVVWWLLVAILYLA